MFKIFSLGLAVLSITVLGAPTIVSAVEDEQQTVVPMTTSIEPVPTPEDVSSDDMTPEELKDKREARIKEAKEKMTVKITAAEEKKIANVCKSSQTKIEKLQTNIDNIVANRQEKYTKISTKLTDITAKLVAAGADTTELEAAIDGMEAKVLEVNTAIEAYNTSLSDLAFMDCESDPSGFKAALQLARSQRTDAVLMTGTVKTYVNETIKPVLQSLRATLTTNTTTTEEGDTN